MLGEVPYVRELTPIREDVIKKEGVGVALDGEDRRGFQRSHLISNFPPSELRDDSRDLFTANFLIIKREVNSLLSRSEPC